MTQSYIYYGLAALMGVLVPLVPKMVRLRILVLRKLHLNRLAEFHERHLAGLTWFIRAVLVAVALLLVWMATQVSAVGP